MTGRALPFVLGGIAGALGGYALSLSPGPSGDVFPITHSPFPRSTDEMTLAPADFSELPTTSMDDAAVDRFEESVERDPIAALVDATAIREPHERRRTVMLVGALWARTDPVAALQQAYRLPPLLEADF